MLSKNPFLGIIWPNALIVRSRTAQTFQAIEGTDKLPVNVRGVLEVALPGGNAYDLALSWGHWYLRSKNAPGCTTLTMLSSSPDYEFLKRGVRYSVRNRVIFSIYHVSRVRFHLCLFVVVFLLSLSPLLLPCLTFCSPRAPIV